MKIKLLIHYGLLLFIVAIFNRCTDPHERYNDPPWLGGTNIETLEKSGNYDQFLALMDKADYRTSIENQMFTLFVSTDSSFEEYFKTVDGKSSVADLSKIEAKELFGQHMLINPRSREQLMYEYAWGELENPDGEYGTLYIRKQTYSVPVDYSEKVRYYEDLADETVKVYHENTFISVWTTEFFADYFGAEGGEDYIFMYPNSEWSGTQWHDAMVIGDPAKTSTGFIYYIDRVVAPIPTIDQYLSKNQDKFGVFYDLAQRFAHYDNLKLDENNDPTYRKGYDVIHDFADERGPDGDGQFIENKMNKMFSSFIPYDHVLEDYLNSTVYRYYESIDSVPELFLQYLLQSHLMSFLVLPSKMNERFFNHYGDKIDINIEGDIGETFMCNNGPVYAMNKVLEPNAFTCVPGPIFYNNKYTTFLYALDKAGLLSTLTQEDLDVTLLAADNEALFNYGIRQIKSGNETILEYRNSDGVWDDITNEAHILEQFVQDHYCLGIVDNFNGEEFLKMASGNHVHYKDGKLVGGGNQLVNDAASIVEKIESEKNGNLFYIDTPIKKAQNTAQHIFSDPDLSSFADLLIKAELIDSVQIEFEQKGVERPKITFIGGEEIKQWTVLAPTNQAIADAQAAGLVPADTLRDELRKFLYYHFSEGQCVFDDGEFSGTLETQRTGENIGTEVTYELLTFINSPNNLKVQDKSGQLINIEHANANNLVETGVVHKINSVLIVESVK